MRRYVVGSLLVSCATLAHADDPRDVFGLGKKPAAEQESVDCGDGTEFGCVTATDPLAEAPSPYALATWLPAKYLLALPVANATHNVVAHFALGAGRDEAGPTFGGATGLENRWLVGGAPADGLRTGVADPAIPLTFLDGMWVSAGGFAARDRVSTGGQIDVRLRSGTTDHELEAYAWAGWSAANRHGAIPPNSYFVRRGIVDFGPEVAASIVGTGPLGDVLGGTAWYAAGVAPELGSTKFTWTAATIEDVDNDGNPDGYPGVVATDFIHRYSRSPLSWRVPYMLRAGFDRGVHHADISIVGSAGSDVRYLFNSTLQAAGVDGITFVGDAIATWRGQWKNTHARGQLAWFRTMRRESARDPAAAGIPQQLSAYVPVPIAEDPALNTACSDDPATDRFPMVPNCPVPFGWFYSGGAGLLVDSTGDRPTLSADVAHRIGNNVVRLGATGEDTRLVNESSFTGGAQIRSLFRGHTAVRRFADADAPCSTDPTLPCPTVDTSELSYRTRYTAAYLEDTWHATPDIAVDAGLRWELMWVGPVLHFSDQLSPRLGMSWDPLGGGRSRVWTSMGRAYAHLPAGLGPTIIRRDKTVDETTFGSNQSRSIDGGAPIAVSAAIQPIAQDELTAGAQVALHRAVRLTMWAQGRWLRRGIETTPMGFDNPGRLGGTAATRDTGIFAAEVATSPTAKTVLRVGYMYGRTIGSWTGAYDPRQGAVLYAGSDFDGSTVNMTGPLPTDLGNRTYIEAERSGHVGSVKLGFAARLTAGSGRPRSVVGESDEGTIFLIPRGTAGRDPVVTLANIRISALWRGLDITLDLFNVFNRREAVATDETYAQGAIRPIDQGTLSDLVFLKTVDGTDAIRRPTFGTATSFQSPMSAVLGVRHAF